MVCEIRSSEIEIPKYLIEPLFRLICAKLRQSILTNHLYSLEILIDAVYLLEGTNVPA